MKTEHTKQDTMKSARYTELVNIARDAENKLHVRLANQNDEQGEGSFRFCVHGALKYDEGDAETPLSVYLGDDPRGHGTNASSFGPRDILDFYRQPSGLIYIVLK